MLAAQFGCTVAEMEDRLSQQEYLMWRAYHERRYAKSTMRER